MSVVDPGALPVGVLRRVKSILLKPSATWDVIDVEPATVPGLFKGYVIPLALIPAVCGLIGLLTSGVGMFGLTYRPSVPIAVGASLLGFLLTMIEVYLLSLIISWLAPRFGGIGDRIQALKLIAYACAAVWVAGVFGFWPVFGGLATIVGGIYSLYLLYLGLPVLMKTPHERALSFFAVLLICAIVFGLLIGAATTAVTEMDGPFSMSQRSRPMQAMDPPGDRTLDLAEIERASRAAALAIDGGDSVKPVDVEVLKAYLPADVAGYQRAKVSTASTDTAGIETINVQAQYAKGPAHFTLSVADMAEAGRLAGLAGVLGLRSSKEENGAYEKIGKVDGRLTQEAFDAASGRGEYSVMVAERFMVRAEGEGVEMSDLKRAVDAVGVARLEQLARAG